MFTQFLQKASCFSYFQRCILKSDRIVVFEEKQQQYQEENRKINASLDQKAIWAAIASVEMK